MHAQCQASSQSASLFMTGAAQNILAMSIAAQVRRQGRGEGGQEAALVGPGQARGGASEGILMKAV